MSQLFIFSTGQPTDELRNFRAAIAPTREQAKLLILNGNNDSIKRHLKEQIRKGGVYAHLKNIEDAFDEYFTFCSEVKLEDGVILRGNNVGIAILARFTLDHKNSE